MSRARGRDGDIRRDTLQDIIARARSRRDDGSFDPTLSPLHRRLLVVTGAPRSGTTWVHQMLAAHPDVATGGESHLFCEGLTALFANYDDPDEYMHLSTWVSRPELVTLARQLADSVFGTAIERQRPDASHVLDKTPNHAGHAALLAQVYPDATVVHVVRHARDVVGSQHDLWAQWDPAAADWGSAAQRWRAMVLDTREHLSPLRYVELRYEDLLAEPVAGVQRMLQVAGLRRSRTLVEGLVRFGSAPINVRPSDSRIVADKWAGVGPDAERQIVSAAGDLLVELGYLNEAQRAEILARKTGRRDSLFGTALRSRRRRVDAARDAQARSRNRATAIAFVERYADASRPRPADDVPKSLEVRGQPVAASDVAAALEEELAGTRIVEVDVDEQAAAVYVVTPDERRLLVRCFADRAGHIGRVVLQGE